MGRLAKQAAERARQVFQAARAEGHDVPRAAEMAGVTPRTGRRWAKDSGPSTTAVSGQPSFATPFHGRSQDLTAIGQCFLGGARLVTVLGPPGVGKTRLAARWLECDTTFDPEDTIFCDLRRITTSLDLITEIARHLGVQLTRTESAAELGSTLSARNRCLLVLDNFEQLVEGGATQIATWLDRAPELRVLITSRRRLRLQAEAAVELAPLPVPSETASEEDIWNSDAVRVFWDRAVAAEPSLLHSSVAPSDLAAIARSLQGIPLALELGAARTRSERIRDLRDELRVGTLGLQSPWRDTDPSQATLRRAVERSWNLLSEAEQATLAQLSVFRNGLTLESARAVVRLDQEISLTEVLTNLRDASLLYVCDGGHGPRRWDLLEAIREYAAEQLGRSGRIEETVARHAALFLEQGERCAADLTTSQATLARRTMAAEFENFRGALDWFERHGEGEQLLRMAQVLVDALLPGLPAAAVELASRALDGEDLQSLPPSAAQVLLRVRRALALRETGGSAAALVDLDHAMALVEKELQPLLSDREIWRLRGEVALARAWVVFYRGEGSLAREEASFAVDCAVRAGAGHLEGRARSVLGEILADVFADPAAFDEHDQALQLLSDSGDLVALETAARRLAFDEMFFDRGTPKHFFSLQNSGADGDFGLSELAYSTFFRACLAMMRGEPGISFELFSEAYCAATRAGDRRLLGPCQVCWALTLDQAGFELGRVSDRLGEALELFTVDANPRYEALTRALLAGVCAREAHTTRAARLLEDADRLLAPTGDVRFAGLATLQRAHLDLSYARKALSNNDPGAVENFVSRVKQRCEEAKSKPLGGSVSAPTLTECCGEARVCLLLVERELEEIRARQLSLEVAEDGSWLRFGASSRLTIADGPLIRRFLLELVEHRRQAPGKPLSSDELVARCWPGERMSRASGHRRVKNLVRRLRQSGLDRVLLTGESGGYLLDPAAPLRSVKA